MIRLTALLLGLTVFLTSCSQMAEDPQDSVPARITLQTQEMTSETSQTEPVQPVTEAEVQVPEYSEEEIELLECVPFETESLIEFEDGTVSGTAVVDDKRGEYSGAGYVTGVYGGGSVLVEIDIPSTQHYDITLRAASDEPCRGKLIVGGAECGTFSLSGGEFEALRFDSVCLTAGACGFTISELSAPADFDCILIEDAEPHTDFKLPDSTALCTSEPSQSAAALYRYITENYSKKILSGQQCTQGTNAEADRIYKLTGRYPAIRFGELMDYSAGADSGDIELAIEWAKSGGIVGYVWNWTVNGSVYADRTAFDLSKAVTNLDIAAMGGEALALRCESGDIAVETLMLIDGIDNVADVLRRLKDEDIPVLFRPLPEASGGQFWWSESVEDYLWLYKLIFERMTIYHGLDNLIWIWNGQSADWYVGDDMCDIISLDIYLPQGDSLRSGLNLMAAAHGISDKKPVALSETSALPSPYTTAQDGAIWSFCASWTGDYSAEGSYTPAASWISFYNNSLVITKDEIEYNW